jgi:hypothetical protein
MAQPLIEVESHPTNTFAQWYGVLGGPIWWAMQLQANYSLVPQACKTGDMKWVHISSVVFILLALSAVAWAWIDWRTAKRTSPISREDAEARSAFMGMLGMLTSSLFTLLILTQAIPTFIFDPCQQ